ncbi:MAG: sigma-54 dependent transcriptional regulator [Candidatus Desulfofervidaceae bacterium]|nr:sigma-54 dependent transcriptional regulator [Candidatus Desulfofervidaceae bacterium]
MSNKAKIAIIDDEKIVCSHLKKIFSKEGYDVITFLRGEEALKHITFNHPSIVLLDLKLPDVDGLEILEKIKSISPETEVIIMTGYASIETAIEAIKKGAFHYLTKPLKLEELRLLIKKAEEKICLQEENRRLKDAIARYTFADLVGKSLKMQKIYKLIMKVSHVDCNVLIQGESGTGKELVAKAIHYNSPRKHGPFVPFNCGAFTEELIASELFGYEKGAFTGAYRTKIGLLESANGGTVFLDEISEMSLPMQVKLLRVIQEKKILRVGGTNPINLDIRIIAATNKNLRNLIREGKFREDLFYRLNVVFINLPPLRERKEDIPLLIQHFLNKYNAVFGKYIKSISKDALERLLKYPFPGNVRELENIIERAVALAEGENIEIDDLPSDIYEFEIETEELQSFSLAEQEKYCIKKALETTGYNKTKAAKLLGFSRITLWRKMRKYGF